MIWQSALWEILHRQTTSVKQRNTGERRQVKTVLMAYFSYKKQTLANFAVVHSGSNEASVKSAAGRSQTGDLCSVGGMLTLDEAL